MKKILVYTTIYGKYDNLPLISKYDPTIQYICFTDNIKYCEHSNKHGFWKIVYHVPCKSPKDSNRLIKLFPATIDSYFKVDYSVYIDANINIDGDIKELVLGSGCLCISTYNHGLRRTVYEELIACTKAGYISISDTNSTLDHLQRLGYCEHSCLQECSVILRNHKHESTNKLSCIWWILYKNFGVNRDQIWFSLALQLSNAPHTSLGESDPRYKHKYFSHEFYHNFKLKINQRLMRRRNQFLSIFGHNIGIQPY